MRHYNFEKEILSVLRESQLNTKFVTLKVQPPKIVWAEFITGSAGLKVVKRVFDVQHPSSVTYRSKQTADIFWTSTIACFAMSFPGVRHGSNPTLRLFWGVCFINIRVWNSLRAAVYYSAAPEDHYFWLHALQRTRNSRIPTLPLPSPGPPGWKLA